MSKTFSIEQIVSVTLIVTMAFCFLVLFHKPLGLFPAVFGFVFMLLIGKVVFNAGGCKKWNYS